MRQGDVPVSAQALPGQILFVECTYHFGGHTGYHHRRRNHLGNLHKRHGRDQGVFTHHRFIKNHRIHTDQGTSADSATVDHRAMANMAARLHHAVKIRQRMDHAVILNIGISL